MQTTLNAPDISCDHCIQTIKSTVEKLPGVQFLSGDPEAKVVTIEHDPAQTSMETIESAMEEEGYPVKR